MREEICDGRDASDDVSAAVELLRDVADGPAVQGEGAEHAGPAGEGGNSSADGRTTKAPPPAPAGSPIKNGNVETGKGTRVERLEGEIRGLMEMLGTLNTSLLNLQETVEDMRPAYNQAIQVLATSGVEAPSSKTTLVFHGIPAETLERQMESEPEFCRDVIETRVKEVFREHLKISRDMPFTQVYRMDMPNAAQDDIRPIVVGFRSARDRDNILRHSTLLRKAGICITEDFSGKGSMPPRQEEAASETPPSPQKKKQQPQSEPPAQPHLAATSPKKSPKKRAKNRNLGQKAAAAGVKAPAESNCNNSDYPPSSHSGGSSNSSGGSSVFA